MFYSFIIYIVSFERECITTMFHSYELSMYFSGRRSNHTNKSLFLPMIHWELMSVVQHGITQCFFRVLFSSSSVFSGIDWNEATFLPKKDSFLWVYYRPIAWSLTKTHFFTIKMHSIYANNCILWLSLYWPSGSVVYKTSVWVKFLHTGMQNLTEVSLESYMAKQKFDFLSAERILFSQESGFSRTRDQNRSREKKVFDPNRSKT